MDQAVVATEAWAGLAERLQAFTRVMKTKAAIGQTPKELVWALNKAKLYRYLSLIHI